jgi:hypothetical protein
MSSVSDYINLKSDRPSDKKKHREASTLALGGRAFHGVPRNHPNKRKQRPTGTTK